MVNWNDSAKYRLLLSIISVMDVKAPDWVSVAQKMGEGYTPEAVRQQYQKIKRNAAAELTGSDSTTGPATPRKRGPKAANGDTPAKSATGKRGKGGAERKEDNEMESPTKKVKKEEGKARAALETEHDSEDGGDIEADEPYA